MNKLIKLGNKVIVQTSEGVKYEKDNVTKEQFYELSDNLDNDEYIKEFFVEDYAAYKKELNSYNELTSLISEVPFISKKGDSYYWEEISPLSLPQDFAEIVLKAFKNKDEKALHAYKNFWILLSLNPNDECRKNLWWFLTRHDLKISSSGFFVAYRNVCKTDKENVYTDEHTKTFKISIGNTVSMPREECDPNNHVMCSTGYVNFPF